MGRGGVGAGEPLSLSRNPWVKGCSRKRHLLVTALSGHWKRPVASGASQVITSRRAHRTDGKRMGYGPLKPLPGPTTSAG